MVCVHGREVGLDTIGQQMGGRHSHQVAILACAEDAAPTQKRIGLCGRYQRVRRCWAGVRVVRLSQALQGLYCPGITWRQLHDLVVATFNVLDEPAQPRHVVIVQVQTSLP